MKLIDGLHAFVWRDITRNNCNTYFIDGSKKILIDPGLRSLVDHVRTGLLKQEISFGEIDVVIVTHGHPDHLDAVQVFEGKTLFAMSEEEYRFIEKSAGSYYNVPKPAFFLREGELKIGDTHLQVINTPGHSPGSISLYWADRKVLFTGDVVFSRGIGRTDLPGGKGSLLKKSIQRLAELDVMYLLPGHGEIISSREAVRANFAMIEQSWFSYLE